MSAIFSPTAFADKVVLITGAASGIGRATALAFAATAASVVVADVDEAGGRETARHIADAGGEAHFIRADVAQTRDVEAMVAETVATYGRLDYAHNNAGIEGYVGALIDYPEELWDQVLQVNLKGVWLCLKYEIRQMLRQGGGAIVNTASSAGLRGSANLVAYSASKFGVVGLTKSAARQYATAGIRINAVCPTLIATPMVERAFGRNPTVSVPMGRMGTPEEVAASVLWLCSEGAAFLTGHALPVDGGLFS